MELSILALSDDYGDITEAILYHKNVIITNLDDKHLVIAQDAKYTIWKNLSEKATSISFTTNFANSHHVMADGIRIGDTVTNLTEQLIKYEFSLPIKDRSFLAVAIGLSAAIITILVAVVRSRT